MGQHYSSLTAEQTLKDLNSSKEGLSEAEAKQRLQKYGTNELKKKKKTSPLEIFFRQFTSFIVIILLAATGVSALIGEYLDAVVILIIIVLNGIFGFVQEYKAEKAIEALQKLTALKTKVIRNGKEQEIDSKELVPGDIILLETGNKVPADARIIETVGLQADEASLTGESVPAKKHSEALKDQKLVSDMANMVFMGTIITKGRATAVIIGTGMETQIGKIAHMVQSAEHELTPLQQNLKV